MTGLIIESEQRVGSRWMHYLLRDLYGMKTSPEIDGSHYRRDKWKTIDRVHKLISENKIVKFHHIDSIDLEDAFYGDGYKVLSVVRNPRDRGVSLAFHHKYEKKKRPYPQFNMTEKEAINYTVLGSEFYSMGNSRMLNNMITCNSILSTSTYKNNFKWVAYEWLLEDTVYYLTEIDRWLGFSKKMTIKKAVSLHTFKRKSGRKPGQEQRDDVWRRKGVTGDWENWFTDDMIQRTQEVHRQYYNALRNSVLD